VLYYSCKIQNALTQRKNHGRRKEGKTIKILFIILTAIFGDCVYHCLNSNDNSAQTWQPSIKSSSDIETLEHNITQADAELNIGKLMIT
jgi:hypothetical protein